MIPQKINLNKIPKKNSLASVVHGRHRGCKILEMVEGIRKSNLDQFEKD